MKFKMRKSELVSLDSREISTLSLLIPFFIPNIRTDTKSQLPHLLASIVILGGLKAHKPLVVSVPAVVRLVLSRESSTTGSGFDRFDQFHSSALLFSKLGGFIGGAEPLAYFWFRHASINSFVKDKNWLLSVHTNNTNGVSSGCSLPKSFWNC